MASTTEDLKTAITKTAPQSHPAVTALQRAMNGIKEVLPAHITSERMAKISLGMLRTNKKLADAAKRNPTSFVSAIMDASRLGLEPGFGAHLVPYENKKDKTIEIQMIPDYRGLLDIARRSGDITSVTVQIAYEHDDFSLELGLDEKLVHKPQLRGDRGAPLLVYGVAHFRDGSHHLEWMSIGAVNAIRDKSQGYKTARRYERTDTPWIESYEEMARKTLVRRMCKYLPRSVELQNAERLMDAADTGRRAHFEGDFAMIEDEDIPETSSAAPSVGNGGEKGAPAPTYADVAAALQKAAAAMDHDALMAAADLIQHVEGEGKQGQLTEIFQACREKIEMSEQA